MNTMTTTISFYQSPAKLRTYVRPLKWTLVCDTEHSRTIVREAYRRLLVAGTPPLVARDAIISIINATDTGRLKVSLG